MSINAKVLKSLCETYTLLYVEDDDLVREEVSRTLRRIFKEVHVAKDGEEGLEAFKTLHPHMVISDIGMPRKNGIEMAEAIKELSFYTPIIITTAYNDERYFLKAIECGVDGFLLKPIDKNKLYEAISRVAKILIAQQQIEAQQREEVTLLSEKIAYSDYHEHLSFQKELKMIRNDFYYRFISNDGQSQMVLADFLYRSKDLLSGDSYSARRLGAGRALFIVVDGMGKGLSASLSAMMSMAFMNHLIDTMMCAENGVDFQQMLEQALGYLKSILVEEEILSAIFLVIDSRKHTLEYASFSMPPALLMSQDGTIERLKSNNPPINAFFNTCHITQLCYTRMSKLLIYSDGVCENKLLNEEGSYAHYLAQDFKQAISREDLVQRMNARMGEIEDDMTFIFLHLIVYEPYATYTLGTHLSEVEKAETWYNDVRERLSLDTTINTKATLAFSELLMNAYEHGNLAINKDQKHMLIDEEAYFDFLARKEKECARHIHIKLFLTTNHEDQQYLLTWIEDEGEGFDTALLSTIFGIKRQYNGRGVFMSKRSSLGIYYNQKGNGVLFITKI